ncbi:putative F-box/kelch-repeat protein At4g22430 [Coffea eugenioides]|uniref:putative F-box/kelch-repeat protein At4g22430 n=1 Tax=Coffea eugenioides TaxID=49369 RepID=UPI000F60D2F6|nr:putative F-box/kelch-repeat protein At4g22430 [Coffea eugenioides]
MDSGRECGTGLASRSGLPYIPESVVVELLIRLPMKCVFRCKCVCKQWRSLIDAPSFGHAFSRIASPFTAAQPKLWTLLYKCIHGEEIRHEHGFFRNLFSNDVGVACLTKSDLPPSAQAHGTDVYGILDHIIAMDGNGLLLCGSNSGWDLGRYYILNPITKQYVGIPPSKRPFAHCRVGFISQVKDSVVTSYKVIRLEDGGGRTSILKLDIFSSETGEWRDIEIPFQQVLQLFPLWKMPVVLKEILHFMDRKLGILAYDPYKGPHSYRIIQLPGDIDREWSKSVGTKGILFDVHHGRLRFFVGSNAYNDGYRISMWTLSDYEEGLWLLEHRINLREAACDSSYLRSSRLVPIAFHPYDSDTVYLGYEGSFLSYDYQSQQLLELDDNVTLPTDNVTLRKEIQWCFVYRFMLPLWPVSIQASTIKVQENEV